MYNVLFVAVYKKGFLQNHGTFNGAMHVWSMNLFNSTKGILKNKHCFTGAWTVNLLKVVLQNKHFLNCALNICKWLSFQCFSLFKREMPLNAL